LVAVEGEPPTLFRRQRVHAAAAVEDLPRAPGHIRRAAPGDIPLVLDWICAFAAEALGDEAPHVEDAGASYRRREADPDGAWLVWEDDGVVSLAAYGNPTSNGTRVGPVYTPPERRGRGYATSLVTELTAERLASGLAFCFLFTDLANPTSNAIYKRIGYDPVADWDQWGFASPALQD
jgi:predicted GNAT family acetyltransferase